MRKRTHIDLSRGWSFARGRMGRRWLDGRQHKRPLDVEVDLPHCWNEEDTFQEGVYPYRGCGSYRRRFRLPAGDDPAGSAVWRLESEGFYGTGDVWLNGAKVAAVDGQYLGFALDVGLHLSHETDNMLGIRLTNRCSSAVLPGIEHPDFLLYGGLAGRVRLTALPALHLDNRAMQIVCEGVTTGKPLIRISFAIHNASDTEKRCRTRWTIEDLEGRPQSDAAEIDATLPASGSHRFNIELRPDMLQAWSPATPCLYRAVGRLGETDEVLDQVEQRFGFREAAFKPGQGFHLNGKRVPLCGCNRHESMPGFGNALPLQLHRQDAEQIKALGLNFVRLSHYPQHPAFLDACDELGLMVYAEIATWKSVRGGRWLKAACRQMRDLITRDRNHPGIILWGMGNESRHRGAYLQLQAIARELDPTRPVTYAENHIRRARRKKTLGIPDVWACNYEFEAMEEGRDASSLKAVVVSECSNYPLARRGALEEEAEQAAVIERDLAALAGKPYVAGFALWCFNDYATLRKERFLRYSGIVDAWRLPKLSAFLLQALYTRQPFVRLAGDWGEPAEQALRRIHVFTNCGHVTLLRNGRPLAELAGDCHYVRDVEYEAGELAAVARGEPGEVMDLLKSHGPARLIELTPPHAVVRAGATLAVTARVLDRNGVLTTAWNRRVHVDGDGALRLRAYRADHEVDLARGEGRLFVTAGTAPGTGRVRVSHPELEPAVMSVEVIAGQGTGRPA